MTVHSRLGKKAGSTKPIGARAVRPAIMPGPRKNGFPGIASPQLRQPSVGHSSQKASGQV